MVRKKHYTLFILFSAIFLVNVSTAHAISSFTIPLALGTTHPEVKQLQVFLNTRNFTVAHTGPGSTGQETETFGPATKSALIRFQETYRDDVLTPAGLTVGNGYFGPYSVAKANTLLAGTTSIEATPHDGQTKDQPSGTPPPKTTSASTTRYLTEADLDKILKRIDRNLEKTNDRINYSSPIKSLTGVTLGDATFEDTDASFDLLSVSGNTSLATLTVTATTTLSGRIVITSNTAPADTTDTLYNTNGDLYWAGNVIGGASTGQWSTDGTNVWRTAGNVGIGTTSPGYSLSVAGAIQLTGNINWDNGASWYKNRQAGVPLMLDYSSTTVLNASPNNFFGFRFGGGYNKIFFGHNGMNAYIGAPRTDPAISTGDEGGLILFKDWHNGTPPTNLDDGIANYLFIGRYKSYFSLGNVGIGTTTPSQKLTVVGNVYASSFIDDGITLTAPDYVFDDPNYLHLSLADIEAYTKENTHLPWLTPRGSGAMSLSARINEVLEGLENLFLQVFKLADWNKTQDVKIEGQDTKIEEQDKVNQEQDTRIQQLEAEIRALKGEAAPTQPEQPVTRTSSVTDEGAGEPPAEEPTQEGDAVTQEENAATPGKTQAETSS